jgi:hypothetical protein
MNILTRLNGKAGNFKGVLTVLKKKTAWFCGVFSGRIGGFKSLLATRLFSYGLTDLTDLRIEISRYNS